MNKNDNSKLLTMSKKIKAIKYKGGECKKCKTDDIYVLCFHHTNKNEKEYEWNELRNKKWSLIQKELEKCELLCHNCHAKYHYEEDIFNKNRRKKYKNKLLEIKGGKCAKCGYNESPGSLDFHHKKNEDKKFCIATRNNISDIVIEELEKCEILCKNCHQKSHTDINFYENNKNKIYEKIKSYKEEKTINHDLIDADIMSGMKQFEIRKKYNLSKSTTHYIYKKYKDKK